MKTAISLYRYKAKQEGDLSFREDELIEVLEQPRDGWWKGKLLKDGSIGVFPYNYVEILSADQLAKQKLAGKAKNENRKRRNARKGRNNNNSNSIDYIRKIEVKDIPNKAKCTVVFNIPKTGKVSKDKTMSEFRELDQVLRLINPNFDKPLPPMWADKISLDSAVADRKTNQLYQYLKSFLGDEALELAMVNWLDNKTQFSVSPDAKRKYESAFRNVRDSDQDNKNSLMTAMMNVSPLAKCISDRIGEEEVELDISQGDIVAVTEKETDTKGWYECEAVDGVKGLVPKNFLRMLKPDEVKAVVLGKEIPAERKKYKQPKRKGSSSKKSTVLSPDVRNRKQATFLLDNLDAFDEMMLNGFTVIDDKTSKPLEKKSGKKPRKGDKVSLGYLAYVWDCQQGKIIEYASGDLPDSKGQTRPLFFTIGSDEVVKGLQEAVLQLTRKQEARVVITPEMAYGDVGSPPFIPPNSHLVYDIRVEDFGKQIEQKVPKAKFLNAKTKSSSSLSQRRRGGTKNGSTYQTQGNYNGVGAVPTALAGLGKDEMLASKLAKQASTVNESSFNGAPVAGRKKRKKRARKKGTRYS
eukprot:maker-scaffold_14-snap-gene-6.55-mRNA-1 protein AED:0.00 eAED:0.00 QI:55/1/1/1/1/1/2/93/579